MSCSSVSGLLAADIQECRPRSCLGACLWLSCIFVGQVIRRLKFGNRDSCADDLDSLRNLLVNKDSMPVWSASFELFDNLYWKTRRVGSIVKAYNVAATFGMSAMQTVQSVFTNECLVRDWLDGRLLTDPTDMHRAVRNVCNLVI